METTAPLAALGEEKHNVVAFPVVGAARPKRRWKKVGNETTGSPSKRVIVPMPSEGTRPIKFTRSGKCIQIWKAPSSHGAQAEPERTLPAALFTEFLAFYLRTILSQSGTRFRLAP
jgi:hypothetical protein